MVKLLPLLGKQMASRIIKQEQLSSDSYNCFKHWQTLQDAISHSHGHTLHAEPCTEVGLGIQDQHKPYTHLIEL